MRELSTQIIVFTDLVASTAQRAAVGDDVADGLLRRHSEVARAVVEAAHGRVVKSLGDGEMACFGSAVDAVGAAVRLQQAMAQAASSAPADHQLTLRIGVSAGDVREAEGDLFGTPVVEAARLCAAAAGGEVLVAELVRLLARGRSSVSFEPVGALELRGLPEPVAACRVLWKPLASPATQLPLPALLAATGGVLRGAGGTARRPAAGVEDRPVGWFPRRSAGRRAGDRQDAHCRGVGPGGARRRGSCCSGAATRACRCRTSPSSRR